MRSSCPGSPVRSIEIPVAPKLPVSAPFVMPAEYSGSGDPNGDYPEDEDGYPQPVGLTGASGVVSSKPRAPSARRWWPWASGATVLVAAFGYLALVGNDDPPAKTDPSQARAALSPAVAAFIDAASLELTAPVVIDAFSDKPGGQLRVENTPLERNTWPTHSGRGFAVRAVVGVPDATTRTGGLAIFRLGDNTAYYVVVTHATPANVRLLRLTKGRQELVAEQLAMRGSWVGPVALEVVWTDSMLTVFVDEQPVLGPINVGAMQPTRVSLYSNGGLSFDSLVSGSLGAR